MAGRMPVDYAKLAEKVVAVTFPGTDRPPLLKAAYPEHQWKFILDGADSIKDISAKKVYGDSDEGRKLLMELPDEMLNEAALMGLPDDILDAKALSLGLRFSEGQSKKSKIYAFMSALEDSKQAATEEILAAPAKGRGRKKEAVEAGE